MKQNNVSISKTMFYNLLEQTMILDSILSNTKLQSVDDSTDFFFKAIKPKNEQIQKICFKIVNKLQK